MSKRTLIQIFSLNRKKMFVPLANPIKQVFRISSRYLRSKPWIQIAINTGVVMATGDIIAQCAIEGRSFKSSERKEERFNWLRLSRFLVVGLFIAGPGMFYWYRGLDRYIVAGSLRSCAMKKLAADQIFFLPFYIVIYMISLGVLRGDKMESVVAQVQNHFGENLVASYKVWPVVQLFNFLVVPGQYRVIVINSVAVFWNIYLGWKTEARAKPT